MCFKKSFNSFGFNDNASVFDVFLAITFIFILILSFYIVNIT
jgi:hypothetical protein